MSPAKLITYAIAIAGCAHSQVLFTNFGPGLAYNTATGYFVNGVGTTCSAGKEALAEKFQPSSSAPFGDAKLALNLISGTNKLSIFLETDAGGLPGAILEQIDVTGLAPANAGSVITANSFLHPPLVAGASYWLVAVALTPDTCAGWNENSTGDTPTGTNSAFNNVASPTGPWTFQITSPTLRRIAFQIDGGTGPESAYQVGYASNLLSGDSYVNLTNTGVRNGFDPAGGICANVYVFDPSEELIACCACYVTPDGLRTFPTKQDLLTPLTIGSPESVVIKLIASTPTTGTSCDASSPTPSNIEAGLRAWGTTLHQNTASGKFEITENVFQSSVLSPSELTKLTSYCGFIQANGSGFGICRSCRLGGLGGAQQ
jgi:hypothetical protein